MYRVLASVGVGMVGGVVLPAACVALLGVARIAVRGDYPAPPLGSADVWAYMFVFYFWWVAADIGWVAAPAGAVIGGLDGLLCWLFRPRTVGRPAREGW
jgi:hypothetical protein